MRHVKKKGGPADRVARPLSTPKPVEDINRSWWGCTDQLPGKPHVEAPQEEPPNPLPEYITPVQARKWGIRIYFPGEKK
jgi:hypothetical protein